MRNKINGCHVNHVEIFDCDNACYNCQCVLKAILNGNFKAKLSVWWGDVWAMFKPTLMTSNVMKLYEVYIEVI